LTKAFGLLASRCLSLWKKNQRKKVPARAKTPSHPDPPKDANTTNKADPTSENGDDESARISVFSEKAVSSTTTSHPHAETKSAAKKRKLTIQGQHKVVSFADNRGLIHKPSADYSAWNIPLVNRNIIVELDKDITDRETALSHIVVGIGAIVNDDTCNQELEDIRCEHLNWDKFVKIIEAMEPTYDLSKLWLFYRVLGEQADRRVLDRQSFQYAVGIMEWHQKKADKNRHFFMKLAAPQYRY